MNNKNNQSEINDLDMTKLKKNIMSQYRNSSKNSSDDEKPKKRTVGQRGRAKKYQNLSDDEYQEILKRQRREAAHRFYLKNTEKQIEISKKYYHDHRDVVLPKQLVYQKRKCVENKITKIENSLEYDNNQVCEILEIVNKKRIKVDELKQKLISNNLNKPRLGVIRIQ